MSVWLMICSASSDVAIMAGGDHIIRIKCGPVEIARLKGLLTFASIRYLVD